MTDHPRAGPPKVDPRTNHPRANHPRAGLGGIRHVVWDWNGTLLDDNDAVVSAVNAVCAAYGRPPVTLAEWRAVFCRPLNRCYERLLDRPLPPAAWARVDRTYHDAYTALLLDTRLAADARAGLAAWPARGGTQSLLSMWFHDDLVAMVTRLGLTAHFARIDGLRHDIGGESKAAHLAEHLAGLAVEPAEVVLVGDVLDDAIAAASVGTRCILLSTGMTTRAALDTAGVPVADSITEALALISSGTVG